MTSDTVIYMTANTIPEPTKLDHVDESTSPRTDSASPDAPVFKKRRSSFSEGAPEDSDHMSQVLADAEHSAINGDKTASNESIGTHDDFDAADATPYDGGACPMETTPAAASESQPGSVDESRAATSDGDMRNR
eukprot:UN16072